MGFDLIYQAYPDNCEILERAFLDAEWADYLCFFKRYARPGEADRLLNLRALKPNGLNPSKMDVKFAQMAYRLTQQHPGLMTRELGWGRDWDMLHFLLSERRRTQDIRWNYTNALKLEDDGWGWAIFGHYHIQHRVGDYKSLRHSSSNDVRAALNLFNTVTRATLAVHFEEMLNIGAYKSVQIYQDERGIDGLWGSFNELKAFYELVVRHNEGFVACLF
jgi:hypothetical protein